MSTRPRGYLSSYNPQAATRDLLEQVETVLERYRDELPLTVRQIFYSLVANNGYPKDEKAYARLCEHLNRARRAGWIEFDAIRDDGVMGGPPAGHYADADDFWEAVRYWARVARLDALSPQAVHVELLCEAGGMVPQLQRVADAYSVPVYSSGGFDSLTAKREIAVRLQNTGVPSIVLHLGDFDPSGVSIFDALAEDVEAFLAFDAPEMVVTFERLALTPEQVDHYGLQTAPPKKSDGRSKRWNGGTCQLESLPPDVLADTVRAALELHLDGEIVRERRDQTPEFRREVMARYPA